MRRTFSSQTACGLLNGEYSYAPLEPDFSGRVTYALATPVFSFVISQYCPAVEAHVKTNGVKVNILKGNVKINGGGGGDVIDG